MRGILIGLMAGLWFCALAQNQMVAGDGVTLMYNQPSAVHYQGTKSKTYFGWINSLGETYLRSYDHDAQAFDGATKIRTWTGPDDHAAPALHVVQHGPRAGTLLVASAFHSSPLTVQRGLAPEGTAMSIASTISSRPNTYPRFAETADGTIFLFTRGHPNPNASTRGLVHMYKSIDGGVTWTGPKTIVTWNLNTFVYAGPVRSFGTKIGFAFGIYDSVAQNYRSEVYYIESTDGGATWKTPLGAAATNSIGANIAPIRRCPWGGRTRVWDLIYDSQGRPSIAHVEYPTEYSPIPNSSFCNGIVTQFKGGYWASRMVSPISMNYYPGGLVFDASNPFRIFATIPAGLTGSDLVIYDSLNQGSSWTRGQTVATGGFNVRPQAVANAAPDLRITWLDSRSYTEYRSFDTSVMAHLGILP
ncbi:MAG: BNR-4 repeat-containing protein [Fimbriimonadaceae bacterium]